MIEAVVFDLDGTLVRLPIDYDQLFEKFKKIMRIQKVRPLVDTISRVDEKTKELVFATLEKAELDVVEQISAIEQGMKIYNAHLGKPKALVTLQGKAVVRVVLKKFSLSFDAIITRENTLFRVDQIEKAVYKLNARIGNVLFVGNTDGDADAASKLGCQFLKIP